MKKKIFYWGPFTDKGIGTKKAILNSAKSINKYSSSHEAVIINAIGEWNKEKKNENIRYLNLGPNIFDGLPRYGFIKSRLAFIQIFFASFFKLKKLILKQKPDYLMIHLISSLPLILFILFNFKTKLLFRISGKPNLNFIRSLLWKLSSHKIQNIFCNTKEQKDELIKNKIFSREKIDVLYDPIFSIRNILKERKQSNFDIKFKKNNILLVGRLTRQKNFELMIKAFRDLRNRELKNFKVYILGEGELRDKLKKLIENYNLSDCIFLLGSKKNVNKYYYTSKIFIMTSLWEDPGFVLIESAINNCSIISSDCKSGPREILENGTGGFLFKNNDINSFKEIIKRYLNSNNQELKQMKINVKKNIRKYSLLRHYLLLKELILKQENKA